MFVRSATLANEFLRGIMSLPGEIGSLLVEETEMKGEEVVNSKAEESVGFVGGGTCCLILVAEGKVSWDDLRDEARVEKTDSSSKPISS